MMSILTSTAKICFLCSHPAPAAHFADLAKELEKNNISYEIFAAEKAADVLATRKVSFTPFSGLTDEKAKELAQTISSKSQCLIADVGSPFSAKVFRSLSENVLRIAYWDNPEAFVPGGYSETAKKVMDAAEVLLFANAHLETDPAFSKFSEKKRIGLGYSSLPQEIPQIREERKNSDREGFLQKHGIVHRGQKIAVYFGGANEAYFEKAFPHFLQLLEDAKEDLSDYTFVLQQHPRSENRDGKILEEWKSRQTKAPEIVISQASFSRAVQVADCALYYQTSGNAKFFLSGMQTIQVGHESYPDVLVRNGFCKSATDAEGFLAALAEKTPEVLDQKVYDQLGIRENWPDIFFKTINYQVK